MDFTPLKNCLDRIKEEYNVPGLDCVVYKEHERLFRYFAGMQDEDKNIPMKGDELYFIFSMTKLVTVVAALQLFEKGKFLMSDKLSDYIPEFSTMRVTKDELNTQNAAKITTGASFGENVNANADFYAENPIKIHHLFTMSAGFDYNLEADYIKNAIAEGKTTTLELVKTLSNTVLGFEPGTRFRYSLCHDVLGGLVEVLSGMTLGEYMKKNIFEPLGMKDTFFGLPKDEERLSRMMARYTADENGGVKRVPLECVFNFTDEYESGGAGLTSCVDDYSLLLDALANGGIGKNGNRILSSQTVELLGTNQIDGQVYDDFNELRPGYGYGLGVRTHMDKNISGTLSPIGEFGWDGAAGGFSMIDPVNKVSLTYFQHSHKWHFKVQTEMRNALYKCLNL